MSADKVNVMTLKERQAAREACDKAAGYWRSGDTASAAIFYAYCIAALPAALDQIDLQDYQLQVQAEQINDLKDQIDKLKAEVKDMHGIVMLAEDQAEWNEESKR